MPTNLSHCGKILVILHQEHSSAGRFGRILQAQGRELDVRRPRFGDPLPKTLSEHDGAIVFGGPMSANDEHAWLRREIDWIGVALKEEKPFLGICLGAQMLARHLGHGVRPHPQGRVEVGYYPIHPTEHGHSCCERRFPDRVYQWHREGFDLPKGATLLAKGQDFEAQAFRFGRTAYGFQFHPEVTFGMMCLWTMRGASRLAAPGARPRHRHLEGWLRHDAAVARWSDAFLRAWLDGGRKAA
ncbi:glutamine amidotransferase [Methylocapsa acidiphila]|uniref:glutamine amidotransferase n=1 Tax=Methylocapsa acidiphila TaxID=133552 RepID=UPI00040A4962|nr:glutamine amidotransferase [Methylocapsa acidiphila]